MSDTPPGADDGDLKNHRTVDRVTEILEQVVYRPGISFTELATALKAPKSSVHGFLRGLQAKGWLHEDNRHFYLGPAVYALTLASGHIRAGTVTQAELDALHDDTRMTVFLGVRSGEHLIYIGESGTDSLTGFAARSGIRRSLLTTAGGKALLADWPDTEREAYLRRRQDEDAEPVSAFLAELGEIRSSRVSTNYRHRGTQLALATVVHNHAGETVATAIIVGQTSTCQPRETKLRRQLLKHVDSWSHQTRSPREPI